MVINDSTIQRILWQSHLLTKEQIETAVLIAPSLGKSFTETLVFKNYIPEDTLGKLLAENLGVGYISLHGKSIPKEVLLTIPEDAAANQKLIPFAKTKTELSVAMEDPTNFETINFLEKKTGLIVRPFFAFPDQITAGLAQYKQDISAEFQKILTKTNVKKADLSKAAEDLPTVQMLDTIMDYAVANDASDIHIEGQETNTLVRFRIDGVLHDILVLDSDVQAVLVARIKYLANLKIDEHRGPQDGRFKYQHLGNRVSVRVSVIPTYYGENVVMRILSETTKTQTLDELGFSPSSKATVLRELARPNGIILLTGPTGSGKTTTLYSLLEILNKTEVKISTIEDPIEYSLTRVSQSQVNPEAGFTFANGLRALLRHDPDVIMVGEIRDHDTADISINAALTGHLVLSTLHTNDATSSITRLLDLGIQPFLITSTVRMIVAQRLVRQLCRKCATPAHLVEAELEALSKLSGYPPAVLAQQHFLEPHGCPDCTNGYKGRTGIHELFILTEPIRNLLHTNPSNDQLREAAIKNGMITMIQDGIVKASQGITSLAEIIKEVGNDE